MGLRRAIYIIGPLMLVGLRCLIIIMFAFRRNFLVYRLISDGSVITN